MGNVDKIHFISKVLSLNDTGETGGHQAGMLIPKDKDILSFFPSLDLTVKNPRSIYKVMDDSGESWEFNFIYYNNKFFDGTRNEYRLTGMTAFIWNNALKAGDTVILKREEDGDIFIHYKRRSQSMGTQESAMEFEVSNKRVRLVLGTSWRVVNY